jgi:NMD protein affecting ribosome stability and mRNA decay
MRYKAKLLAAIKAGEIKQCQHCGAYWSPSQQYHECMEGLRAEANAARADLDAALALLRCAVCEDAAGEDEWNARLARLLVKTAKLLVKTAKPGT